MNASAWARKPKPSICASNRRNAAAAPSASQRGSVSSCAAPRPNSFNVNQRSNQRNRHAAYSRSKTASPTLGTGGGGRLGRPITRLRSSAKLRALATVQMPRLRRRRCQLDAGEQKRDLLTLLTRLRYARMHTRPALRPGGHQTLGLHERLELLRGPPHGKRHASTTNRARPIPSRRQHRRECASRARDRRGRAPSVPTASRSLSRLLGSVCGRRPPHRLAFRVDQRMVCGVGRVEVEDGNCLRHRGRLLGRSPPSVRCTEYCNKGYLPPWSRSGPAATVERVRNASEGAPFSFAPVRRIAPRGLHRSRLEVPRGYPGGVRQPGSYHGEPQTSPGHAAA